MHWLIYQETDLSHLLGAAGITTQWHFRNIFTDIYINSPLPHLHFWDCNALPQSVIWYAQIVDYHAAVYISCDTQELFPKS